MTVVGIDPGEARVGLAVSDDVLGMALPLCTVDRTPDVAAQVAAAVEEYDVVELVVGLPLRLDGTEGEAARRARAFGDQLGDELGLPVVYWDERLTTAAAERGLRELGVSGAKRRQVIDQSAAALLLQRYLDAKANRE